MTSACYLPLPCSGQNVRMALAGVEFRKYEGLGNDFILIDNRKSADPVLSPEESARLCDRYRRAAINRCFDLHFSRRQLEKLLSKSYHAH
jgi:hypothetical protein